MHRNSNQGFRYMANNRNGMDLSGVPHGLAGPVFPMTFDGSGVTAPIDNQCPGSTSLASTLAYATPENQRMVY
ncbi:polyadenylate-binding protein [Trifolium repens]|nr:polyadenylate-binding protein [Trifolium repens]